MTLSDIERLGAFDEADRTFQMDEESFRAFYEQTARPVWAYLARMTGDRRLADDLLQETYYRFLRARPHFESDHHRRHYLYRIATNLARDHHRRSRVDAVRFSDAAVEDRQPDPTARAAQRLDLDRAMGRLKPRDQTMLWLAYVQGCSHDEIAASLGVKTASLKALLHRARRRLLRLLGESR